jgi:hypothetical protein
MQGTWHAYYTVELAPAVAALAALGATVLWRRHTRGALAVLAAGSLATTLWSTALLVGHPVPGVPVAIAVCVVGATGLLLLAVARTGRRAAARLAAASLLVAALLGPLTWSLVTAALPHIGAAVRAGPVSGHLAALDAITGPRSIPPALLQLVRRGSDGWTWTAATVGRRAADLQLATGTPVMPIGGFFGRDPAPTLAQFEADVHAHRIHWFVPGLHGSGPAVQIDRWVRAHAPAVRLGSTTVYDLAGLSR